MTKGTSTPPTTPSTPTGTASSSSSSSNVIHPAAALTPPRHSITLLFALIVMRLLNTTVIHSYFNPDEFWQTLEPAYCRVFYSASGTCPGYTWEWTRQAANENAGLLEQLSHGPARSFLSIIPTMALYHSLQILYKSSAAISWFWVARGPMLLQAAFVQAPVDYLVWYVAQYVHFGKTVRKGAPFWSLLASCVSWFHGYTGIRTFANGQEALFMMLAIALVSKELFCVEPKEVVYTRSFHMRAGIAFFFGGLAFAIRNTAVAVWLPLAVLLALPIQNMSELMPFWIGTCGLTGLCGLGIGMAVDYFYYGRLVLPVLGNLHFNVWLDMAALYGAHPMHWYFTSGLPIVAGLLFPLLIQDILDFSMTQKTILSYGQRNVYNLIISYVVILSLQEHKEYRYIQPVLPLLCVLLGPRIQRFFYPPTEQELAAEREILEQLHAQEMAEISKKSKTKDPIIMPMMMSNPGAQANAKSQDQGNDDKDLTEEEIKQKYNIGESKKKNDEMPAALKELLQNDPSVKSFMKDLGEQQARFRKYRLFAVGFTTVSLNLLLVWYFGSVHQSGQVSVQRSIVDAVLQKHGSASPGPLSIQYLNGECHSTPLLSHLHPLGATADSHLHTWSLDCSPSCRADPNATCEYEAFDQNPTAFLNAAYSGEQTCSNPAECQGSMSTTQPTPDFVVTYSAYEAVLKPYFAKKAGLVEVARFPRHISGAALGKFVIVGTEDETFRTGYAEEEFAEQQHKSRSITIGGILKIFVHEVVLLGKPEYKEFAVGGYATTWLTPVEHNS